MKKCGWVLLFAICFVGSVSAQQLTRFAVVDLTKVLNAFFLDSQAVREFEERRARVQADIDRMTREIQELQGRRADAVVAGNQEQALRLETEIFTKSNFLREYYETRTAQLEEQRRRLTRSSDFLEQVHREIRFIAESEGYSMVLNLTESTGILWHSPTVDITDRLIQNLLDRARR